MLQSKVPYQQISIPDVEQLVAKSGNLISYTDTCGFFLCQQGSIEVTLNQQTYHIKKGDIYIYSPSTLISLRKRSRDLSGLMFKSNLDFILPFLDSVVNTQNILLIREHPCLSLTPEQCRRLEHLVEAINERQELLQQHTVSTEKQATHILQQGINCLAQALVNELIYIYFCYRPIEPISQDTKDKVFHKFMISLFKNYKKEREVAFYAKEQCLSPRYFSAIIKEKSGYTALQWIIQLVISNARQMLVHSDLSIKEVAIRFNFPSQSFFGKYFKQYVGMSPKEYRRTQHTDEE